MTTTEHLIPGALRTALKALYKNSRNFYISTVGGVTDQTTTLHLGPVDPETNGSWVRLGDIRSGVPIAADFLDADSYALDETSLTITRGGQPTVHVISRSAHRPAHPHTPDAGDGQALGEFVATVANREAFAVVAAALAHADERSRAYQDTARITRRARGSVVQCTDGMVAVDALLDPRRDAETVGEAWIDGPLAAFLACTAGWTLEVTKGTTNIVFGDGGLRLTSRNHFLPGDPASLTDAAIRGTDPEGPQHQVTVDADALTSVLPQLKAKPRDIIAVRSDATVFTTETPAVALDGAQSTGGEAVTGLGAQRLRALTKALHGQITFTWDTPERRGARITRITTDRVTILTGRSSRVDTMHPVVSPTDADGTTWSLSKLARDFARDAGKHTYLFLSDDGLLSGPNGLFCLSGEEPPGGGERSWWPAAAAVVATSDSLTVTAAGQLVAMQGRKPRASTDPSGTSTPHSWAFAVPETEGTVTVESTGANPAVIKALNAARDTDPHLPALCGVHLTVQEGAATADAVATDRYRIVSSSLALTAPAPEDLEVTLPALAVAVIARAKSWSLMLRDPGAVTVRADGALFTLRTPGEEYPAVERLYRDAKTGKEDPTVATVTVKALASAVRGLPRSSDDDVFAVGVDRDGDVRAWAPRASLAVVGTGEAATFPQIGLSTRRMHELLTACRPWARARMSWRAPVRPVLMDVTGEGLPDLRCLVMPFRVEHESAEWRMPTG